MNSYIFTTLTLTLGFFLGYKYNTPPKSKMSTNSSSLRQKKIKPLIQKKITDVEKQVAQYPSNQNTRKSPVVPPKKRSKVTTKYSPKSDSIITKALDYEFSYENMALASETTFRDGRYGVSYDSKDNKDSISVSFFPDGSVEHETFASDHLALLLRNYHKSGSLKFLYWKDPDSERMISITMNKNGQVVEKDEVFHDGKRLFSKYNEFGELIDQTVE